MTTFAPAEPGVERWIGTHYLTSDSATGPWTLADDPPMAGDASGSWYAGRVVEIDGQPLSQRREKVGIGGIAGKQDGKAGFLDDIPAVAAMLVRNHPSSPMSRRGGLEPSSSYLDNLAPRKFVH